jgi:threonine dehydrogenase-like Zn-dependent dehydrogenase
VSRYSKAWIQNGPESLSFVDLPIPESIPDGYALGRVEANGICGSDYEQYRGTFDDTGLVVYPYIIGHEPLLRIEQITPAARTLWGVDEGDRVVIYPFFGCKVCRYCSSARPFLCETPGVIINGYMPVERGLWGALSEYMMIGPDSIVYKIPEHITTEDAVMYNPLCAGFDWAVERGGVGLGDDVLILGAGQRGLACIVACREAGANRIVITGLPADEDKLKIASALGATDIVITNPEDPRSVIDQIGASVVDVAVDVVPVATRPVVDAIEAVRRGGTVVLGGIKGMRAIPDLISDTILLKGIDIRGAHGFSARSHKRAVEAVLSGKYDFSDWHTHTLPLERADEAIKILGGEIWTGRTPIHITVTGSVSQGYGSGGSGSIEDGA